MSSWPLMMLAATQIVLQEQTKTHFSLHTSVCVSESAAEHKRSMAHVPRPPRYRPALYMHAANMRCSHKEGNDDVSIIAFVSYICATYRTVFL